MNLGSKTMQTAPLDVALSVLTHYSPHEKELKVTPFTRRQRHTTQNQARSASASVRKKEGRKERGK